MFCIIGRCSFVLGQKNVLGKIMDAAVTTLVGGEEGMGQTKPQHFAFLVCGQAVFSLIVASLMS